MSPTARSLKLLRDQGMSADVVEKVLPKTFIRRDFLNCIDIVAVGENGTIGVQTTSDNGGNMAARATKIRESEHLENLLAAGWRLVVHGWKKKGNRWQVREQWVSEYGPMDKIRRAGM